MQIMIRMLIILIMIMIGHVCLPGSGCADQCDEVNKIFSFCVKNNKKFIAKNGAADCNKFRTYVYDLSSFKGNGEEGSNMVANICRGVCETLQAGTTTEEEFLAKEEKKCKMGLYEK